MTGWSRMQPHEKDMLADIIPVGGRYLEIGSWTGTTVAELLVRRPDIRAVSCENLSGGHGNDPYQQQTAMDLCANYAAHRDRWQVWLGTAQQLWALRPSMRFDVVLVDADHEEAAVEADLRTAGDLLERGGYILAHDYYSERDDLAGVRRAVDRFNADADFRVVWSVGLTAVLRSTQ